MSIILYLISLPILTAFIILFIPRNNHKFIKSVAISSAVVMLLTTIYLFISSDSHSLFLNVENYTNFNQVQDYIKNKTTGVTLLDQIFVVGIDNISIQFLLLTTILTLICFVVSNQVVTTKIKEYYICLLLLEGLIIGAFTAVDLVLFYFFFEASLVPIFIIILGWGGEDRGFAALKLFLYTFAGSVLLLVAIIFIYNNIGSTNVITLVKDISVLDYKTQSYLCIAMLIAFAIKIPMWPFHTWLPDAHVQAPTGGSMILAGIIIKIGAYAMIRFCLTLFPAVMDELKYIIFVLSIIAIIYASLVAMAQNDLKKMIAYSSVAHMGYVSIGVFANSDIGLNGAIFQMISHGLISAGLFFAVGIIYERFHTKKISELGGIANVMPKFSLIFVFLTMASIGLPATSGFIGEFLVITSLYAYGKIFAGLAGIGIIFGAVYMLGMVKKVIYGPRSDKFADIKDLTTQELLAFLPLIVLIVVLGVYPNSIISKIEPVVTNIYNIMR